jgi:tetratricopeptide (TPR) repeat protein
MTVDFRYHLLLGAVYLGDVKNRNENILSFDSAEKAFLAAAKYSRHDEPKEAARAMLLAGWSAYCQNEGGRALQHTRDAILLNPLLAEAHFQCAKLLTSLGKIDEALPFLKDAIRIDKLYAVKVSEDGEFTNYLPQVNQVLVELHDEARSHAEGILALTIKNATEMEQIKLAEFPIAQFAPSKIPSVNFALSKARESFSTNTYFGFLDTLPSCESAESLIQSTKAEYAQNAIGAIGARIYEEERKIAQFERAKENHKSLYSYWIVIWLVLMSVPTIVATTIVPTLGFQNPNAVTTVSVVLICITAAIGTTLICMKSDRAHSNKMDAAISYARSQIVRLTKVRAIVHSMSPAI